MHTCRFVTAPRAPPYCPCTCAHSLTNTFALACARPLPHPHVPACELIMQGGAWCATESECHGRQGTGLGTRYTRTQTHAITHIHARTRTRVRTQECAHTFTRTHKQMLYARVRASKSQTLNTNPKPTQQRMECVARACWYCLLQGVGCRV